MNIGHIITIYIISIILIALYQPSITYDHQDHKYRPFGYGHYKQSLLALPILGAFISVIVYNFLYCLYE
jgi:hypothetical protein